MISLTAEVSNYIRKELKSFPDVKPLENKYPIVENDKVFIMNEMHQSKKLRKMHLEIGYTDNIEVMHCVLYPSVDYPIPIFGADIVETPKVITAAIIDLSPVCGTERLMELFKDISFKYNFEENRILPQWGEEIFSEGCKFVRIKNEKEKQMMMQHRYENRNNKRRKRGDVEVKKLLVRITKATTLIMEWK